MVAVVAVIHCHNAWTIAQLFQMILRQLPLSEEIITPFCLVITANLVTSSQRNTADSIIWNMKKQCQMCLCPSLDVSVLPSHLLSPSPSCSDTFNHSHHLEVTHRASALLFCPHSCDFWCLQFEFPARVKLHVTMSVCGFWITTR